MIDVSLWTAIKVGVGFGVGLFAVSTAVLLAMAALGGLAEMLRLAKKVREWKALHRN